MRGGKSGVSQLLALLCPDEAAGEAEGVDVVGRLVAADGFDAGETQS